MYQSLLKEWGYSKIIPTTIYGDNQGAIQLTINHAQHKTRDIDIKFHYVPDLEAKGRLLFPRFQHDSRPTDKENFEEGKSKFNPESSRLESNSFL